MYKNKLYVSSTAIIFNNSFLLYILYDIEVMLNIAYNDDVYMKKCIN